MSLHRAQFEAAATALQRVLTFTEPADLVISRYFRQRPQLGQQDRAFIAESVFGVLRCKRALDFLTENSGERRLLFAWLLRYGGYSIRELTPMMTNMEAEWAPSLKGASLDGAPLGVQADLPDWIVTSLQQQMPDETVLALGRALQQAAPLDLRVNTLKADREAVIKELTAAGMQAQATPLSPIGVRVQGRPQLNRHPAFLDGRVEVQDEGSQLLGYLVAPRRHELVVDFCAGAGGKALMLGAMMQSQGRVYAFDVSAARLARLKPRLKRSGLSNLHMHVLTHENDVKVKRLAKKIDRVLVDAPCSGLGTLRRNPDLKFRQSAAGVAELTVKQAAILKSAANLVKTGGRLVYATCSLLPAENQEIVAAFLAQHPDFVALDAGEILAPHHIDTGSGPQLQLWPHVHNTDGFFAAVLQRK